jgi:hypothetical protein
MSTRTTQLGITEVMDVHNSTRTTQLGLTEVMDVHNNTRATQLGLTVVFTENSEKPHAYAQIIG